MGVPAHLSLVTLGVADVARSTAFYEALGWQRSTASQAEITFFDLGGAVLALYGAAALADDARQSPPPGGGPSPFRAVTLALNQRTPAAVDAVVAAFVAAGATLVKPPVEVEWGGYSGYVADPDGHLWEIAFNPYSPEWAAPASE
jgi:uncharacterized protein